MNKILFTDLDGTLLNDASQISDEMKQALDNMIAAGNKLVLSSGRPLNSILEVKENAGIHYPGVFIIANNGSLVYDCDTQANILELRLTIDIVKQIWALAKEHTMHIQTYTDSQIITAKEDEEILYYRRKIHLPLILSDSPWDVMEQPPFKLLAIDLHKKQHLNAFSDAILQKTDLSLSTIFSSDQYLEIFSSKAGKGNALTWLCNYLDIPIANSIASGDAQNDLSMLQSAGLSVAMLNGDTLLKEQADIITSHSNDDNGLVEIINNYMLP